MDDDKNGSLSSQEMERKLLQHLSEMDSDSRLAFEKMIFWMAERPKDSEPVGPVRMGQMLEDLRLENIRRRLGGKVCEVLPFTRPESKA